MLKELKNVSLEIRNKSNCLHLSLHYLQDIFGWDLSKVVIQVFRASMFVPLSFKFTLQDLGTTFLSQTSLLQAQLTHVHVVDSSEQQHRRLIVIDLHLAGDPLAVEMRVPPALLVISTMTQLIGGPSKRYAEKTLLIETIFWILFRWNISCSADMNIIQVGDQWMRGSLLLAWTYWSLFIVRLTTLDINKRNQITMKIKLDNWLN